MLFTLATSALIFREQIGRRELAGCGLVVAGLLVLVLGAERGGIPCLGAGFMVHRLKFRATGEYWGQHGSFAAHYRSQGQWL